MLNLSNQVDSSGCLNRLAELRAKRKVTSNKVFKKEKKFNFRRHPAGGAVYTSGTHLVGADDSSELVLENSRDFLRPRADIWWLRKERPLVANTRNGKDTRKSKPIRGNKKGTRTRGPTDQDQTVHVIGLTVSSSGSHVQNPENRMNLRRLRFFCGGGTIGGHLALWRRCWG